MKKISETIVFFGSGPVAAKSLDLLAENFLIEAVVTKPKPEHHRGSFPVIDTANRLNLSTHTVSNKAELSSLLGQKPFSSKIGVLIDFGIIVSQDVIDYFPFGIVNSHFSLLPEWRGADPITFAILSGQAKTGVSLMLLDAGMDTGKILVQKSLSIQPSIINPDLTSQLIDLSNELLQTYLPEYLTGEVKPRSQPHPDRVTYSRRLNKDDGLIDWNKPAKQIEREIRAYIEWPKSYTQLGGIDVIITKAYSVPSIGIDEKPGDMDIVSDIDAFSIATSDGSLWVQRLKPAGKKEMSASEFIRGYRNKLGL